MKNKKVFVIESFDKKSSLKTLKANIIKISKQFPPTTEIFYCITSDREVIESLEDKFEKDLEVV